MLKKHEVLLTWKHNSIAEVSEGWRHSFASLSMICTQWHFDIVYVEFELIKVPFVLGKKNCLTSASIICKQCYMVLVETNVPWFTDFEQCQKYLNPTSGRIRTSGKLYMCSDTAVFTRNIRIRPLSGGIRLIRTNCEHI